RIAFRSKRLGELLEFLPVIQRTGEAARIESFNRTGDSFVGLDAAAAVDGTAGIGALQIARAVLPLDILILERVAQVLVEGGVPGTLDQPAARRVIVRRRQRQARAATD